jgi:hypothetical protein
VRFASVCAGASVVDAAADFFSFDIPGVRVRADGQFVGVDHGARAI